MKSKHSCTPGPGSGIASAACANAPSATAPPPLTPIDGAIVAPRVAMSTAACTDASAPPRPVPASAAPAIAGFIFPVRMRSAITSGCVGGRWR